MAKNVGLNASVEAREETFAIIHLIFVALGEDSLRVWDIREAGELESIIIRLRLPEQARSKTKVWYIF